MNTSQRRVYECKEKPNGVRLVLHIDSSSVTVLEGMKWHSFSGVRKVTFSLLGVKPEGRK
jgi:hypothetical protein